VTEELWGHLKSAVLESPLAAELPDWPEALMIASWPEPRPPESWERNKIGEFEDIKEVIRAVRNYRSEEKVPQNKLISSAIIESTDSAKIFRDQLGVISSLALIDSTNIQVFDGIESKPENHVVLVVGSSNIYLKQSDPVDKEEERNRLNQDLAEVDTQIIRLMELLGGPFTQKAPPQVVEKERLKLEGFQKSRDQITRQLEELE
jgi:valyl-tRNA synthetase